MVNCNVKDFRIVGSGEMIIENTKVYKDLIVSLREDYGGSWHGDVVFKNVTMDNNDGEVTLLSNRWYNHYFGFPIFMPETIIIDNLRLTSANTVHIFDPKLVEQLEYACQDTVNEKPNLTKVIPPTRIIIKNNTQGLNFIKPDTEFFKNTEIVEE